MSGGSGAPPVPPMPPFVLAPVVLGAVVEVPWVVPEAAPPVPVTVASVPVVLGPGPPVGVGSLGFDAPSPEHPVARAVRQANNVAEPVE